MGRTIESFCLKRQEGGIVNKAAACTKSDLSLLLKCMYGEASCETDYQDAAMLALMWYLFGRASDLTFLQKRHMSVCSRNVLFVRLVRLKTSEEQGLSLFPDRDARTCPLLAIALALMMQRASSRTLLPHLPAMETMDAALIGSSVPLGDLLASLADTSDPPVVLTPPQQKPAQRSEPGIHAYVNRVLVSMAARAGVMHSLSSHSFRRGGAQHVNCNVQVAPQWIFDRGSWNMSATNKAFAYVFNTTPEDERVSKVLSGWDVSDAIVVPNLVGFDSRTRDTIRRLMLLFFATSHSFADPGLNIDGDVLEVLMAALLRHYPVLHELSPRSPFVRRLEVCVQRAGCAMEDVVAWSTALQAEAVTSYTKENNRQENNEANEVIKHQAASIHALIQQNKRQAEEFAACMRNLSGQQPSETQESVVSTGERVHGEPQRKKKAAITNLSDVWYAWFAREPRGWEGGDGDRKKKSDVKNIVGFLKLFLADGFVLDQKSPSYRGDVLRYGAEAEREALAFLETHNLCACGSGTVLRHMRALLRNGALSSKLRRYEAAVASGAVCDPTPTHIQARFSSP